MVFHEQVFEALNFERSENRTALFAVIVGDVRSGVEGSDCLFALRYHGAKVQISNSRTAGECERTNLRVR